MRKESEGEHTQAVTAKRAKVRTQAGSAGRGGPNDAEVTRIESDEGDDADSEGELGEDAAGGSGAEGSHEDYVVEATEQVTTSTNTADDYAHRGPKLASMMYYVYRTHVYRVRRGKQNSLRHSRFLFDEHYVLSSSYEQQLLMSNLHIPTIDGFQCPTIEEDAEQNALFKSLLFMPWRCDGPTECNCVT